MSAGPLLPVPVSKIENVLMDIVSGTAQGLEADPDTALLEGSLQKYCRSFRCPLQKLPDRLEQDDCDMYMKIDLIFTCLSYILRHKLGLQAYD